MAYPELNPVEIPSLPSVPWTMWLVGAVLLVFALAITCWFLRRHVHRRVATAPPPDPIVRAVQALGSIPDDWSTERAAAAGARILRGFLAVIGFGPGLAHPAREFSGLRSASTWRELVDLLEEMEQLACRPHPSRAAWQQARDLAMCALNQAPRPDSPTTPAR